MSDEDYLIYIDSGACFINDIHCLVKAMEADKKDIMIFENTTIEKNYTKRDAFILMDCDNPYYTESQQRCGGYIVLKNNNYSKRFVNEWLEFAQDERIITNNENVMGSDNYDGFVENRHDQTILSLLSKKWGIDAFRDPSQWGNYGGYCIEVMKRSSYGQIIDSHRQKTMPLFWWVYKYIPRKWYDKWLVFKKKYFIKM